MKCTLAAHNTVWDETWWGLPQAKCIFCSPCSFALNRSVSHRSQQQCSQCALSTVLNQKCYLEPSSEFSSSILLAWHFFMAVNFCPALKTKSTGTLHFAWFLFFPSFVRSFDLFLFSLATLVVDKAKLLTCIVWSIRNYNSLQLTLFFKIGIGTKNLSVSI